MHVIYSKEDSAKVLTPIDIPMDQILSDPQFNCRGAIDPFSVRTLAEDIKKNGLQTPIHVQPWDEQPPYKYRILAGHRRFVASQAAGKTSMACIVKEGLSPIDAVAYNLSENVQREQLNVLQEAKTLERLKLMGCTESEVMQLTGQSRGWVQVRFFLLELPDEIQADAAAGLITQRDIRDLNSLSSVEQQILMAKAIKDKKFLGKKKQPKIDKIVKKNEKHERSRAEINMIQQILYDLFGASFAVQMLAWAQGEIDDRTMQQRIKEEATRTGRFYTIPNHL